MTLQRYVSHKQVHAGKILSVEEIGEGGYVLTLAGVDGPEAVAVDTMWIVRHKPAPGGYYVRYSDDYTSYSPAEAFETGYTMMDEPGPDAKPVPQAVLADVIRQMPAEAFGYILVACRDKVLQVAGNNGFEDASRESFAKLQAAIAAILKGAR